ncbi:MAG: sensor histidine kinase [Acetobacteraceae bacterium]
MTQPQRMAGRISSGVGHDINNSLAVIAGSLDLLEHRIGATAEAKPANPGAAGLVTLIARARNAVQRAADLAAGLHALSRLQSERVRPTDLEQLVAGLTPVLICVAGRRVRLRMTVAPDLSPVAVDPGRLRAALIALCLNAREAMANEGDLTLDLTADTTAMGSFVRVRLADSGSGMAPEVAARAAEPFFTTGDVGAVGLGLTEVAAFMQETGGRFQIETAPGAGTAVSLVLPCAGSSTCGNPGPDETPGPDARPAG